MLVNQVILDTKARKKIIILLVYSSNFFLKRQKSKENNNKNKDLNRNPNGISLILYYILLHTLMVLIFAVLNFWWVLIFVTRQKLIFLLSKIGKKKKGRLVNTTHLR